jgi:toxin ParE1/3/4
VKLRYTVRGAAELDKVLVYIEERSRRARVTYRRVFRPSSTSYCSILTPASRQARVACARVVASPYPYLIFYHATEDEVVIHGVRHAARKPLSMRGVGEQESP